jgi:hypothetical protein
MFVTHGYTSMHSKQHSLVFPALSTAIISIVAGCAYGFFSADARTARDLVFVIAMERADGVYYKVIYKNGHPTEAVCVGFEEIKPNNGIIGCGLDPSRGCWLDVGDAEYLRQLRISLAVPHQ